jgi:hypothetical protein
VIPKLAVGLSPGSYLVGSVSVAVVVVLLGWGAWSLRRALLPAWEGAPARLAEVVMALAAVFGAAQILGSFGAFRRDALFLGCSAAGVAMALVGQRRAAARSASVGSNISTVATPKPEVAVAAIAAGVVWVQWVMHAGYALSNGMTHPDTLWYHAPYAARFLQTGWLTHLSDTGLADVATPLHSYLPLNGSVAHAIVMLPFESDFLSVFLNLGWFALALAAGWCLGRRDGAAGITMLGMVVLLGLPTIAGTQPGQAANDVATMALFVVGVALLADGWMRVVPTALAGVAVGLALGIKLTVLAPAAVLTVGIVVVAIRARRIPVALAWCVALVLAGGYWFVRNWVVVGNPTPWSELELGPLSFDRAVETRPSIAPALRSWTTWDRFVLPALDDAFGPAWPLLVGLALLGAVLGLGWGKRTVERWAGAAAIAGWIAFPFTPFSGEFGGGAIVFFLRYLAAPMMLGLWLLGVAAVRAGGRWRWAFLMALALVALVNLTAPHFDDVPAWPSGEVLAGVAGGILALGVLGAIVSLSVPRWRGALVTAAIAVGVVGLAAGWLVQERYFEDRYVDAGLPHAEANRLFRDLENERVAVLGTEHFYPFFGLELTNHVAEPEGPAEGSATERCRAWRRALRDGEYTYIVLGHQQFSDQAPEEAWLISDSAVSQAHRDENTVVYRVDGRLDPSSCA